MPYYGRDTRNGISGNPLGELFDGVTSYCMDYGHCCNILSMIIYCEQSRRETLAEEFESALKRYSEEHNPDGELHYCDSAALVPFEDGIYVYTPGYTSVEDEDSEIDPLTDPLKAAIEAIQKQQPNARIAVCLPYHFDYGYHYGANYLWTEGNTKPLIAKQLIEWMADKKFWKCCSWEGVDYETILEYLLTLSDEMDAEWVQLFWSHVPANDPELRARLLERLQNWNTNHTDRTIADFLLESL